MHGYAIAGRIQQVSQEALVVEEGSLYPALHRMEGRGLIRHEWGLSDSNRRAKFYQLTAAGRKQLTADKKRWKSLCRSDRRGDEPFSRGGLSDGHTKRRAKLFTAGFTADCRRKSMQRFAKSWSFTSRCAHRRTSEQVCRRRRLVATLCDGSATSRPVVVLVENSPWGPDSCSNAFKRDYFSHCW